MLVKNAESPSAIENSNRAFINNYFIHPSYLPRFQQAAFFPQ